MGATDRIKEYIDYKDITKYKFCKDLGFSNKFLDNSSNMGTDKACKILHQYNDLNPEWLLTGKGSMLKEEDSDLSSSEELVQENKHLKEQVEELKEKTELQKDLIELLKDKIDQLENPTSKNVPEQKKAG